MLEPRSETEKRRRHSIRERRRHRQFAVVTVVISTLVALGAAESLVRLFFKHEIDKEILQKRFDAINFGSFTRPSTNPELVFELIPSIDVEWWGSRVVADDDGYCRISGEVHEPKDPRAKIALLGDSTAFGWRVEYEETYGEVLRRRLCADTGLSLALRNFSLPGYQSRQLRVCCQDRVIPWKPDLLILHYDHNDANPVNRKPRGYMPIDYGDNFLGSSLIRFAARRYREWQIYGLTELSIKNSSNRNKFLGNYCFAGPRYERHMIEMKRIAKLVRDAGIPCVVFIFNTRVVRAKEFEGDPMYRLLHKPLVERLSDMGFHVVDSYPFSQQLMAKSDWSDLSLTWLEPNDAHPSPRGHQLLAGYLFEEVKGLLLRRIDAAGRRKADGSLAQMLSIFTDQ